VKPNNPNGLYSLAYSEFVVPLVKAVQELNSQNQELKQEMEQLKSQMEELRKMIAK
jgi:peptidoglycan hydrolase CwlO-like protein